MALFHFLWLSTILLYICTTSSLSILLVNGHLGDFCVLATVNNAAMNIGMHVSESFPRQVDKKSRGPQGERGLEFSRRKKGQTFFFFPLHSLGLYNNNESCLKIVSGVNLLANSVILKCKLWE